MAIVKIMNKPRKKLIEKAKEEYQTYIKITIDIKQRIVLIGGEYHADAEKILQEEYQSKKDHIWDGGYNLQTNKFETNALINLKQPNEQSMEIINPEIRTKFLKIAKSRLKGIKKYV